MSVDISDVTVEFGDLTAIDGVSLSVKTGEFFTLVGPSGCGKTTLLRSIAGLESPVSGTIRIGGQDMAGRPPESRDLGIVFQNYALFPHMSVRENVAYGLQFRDGTAQDSTERVNELLELVDLSGLGDRDPEQLSGGQQQRVALARALAPEPDVLLLDEPLSALDADLREHLRVQIKSIQQDVGITTVYVTHDQSEALAISDRMAVIHNGHLAQIGTPEAVYREPATRFVAEFVGDTNIFEGSTVSLAGHKNVGGSATLAVRPESISIGADPPAEGTTLQATVETVEFLGDAYRVHCTWGNRTITVKTDTNTPPSGEVTLWFDPTEGHEL
jgi:thiamine transport system ATP-binding protein